MPASTSYNGNRWHRAEEKGSDIQYRTIIGAETRIQRTCALSADGDEGPFIVTAASRAGSYWQGGDAVSRAGNHGNMTPARLQGTQIEDEKFEMEGHKRRITGLIPDKIRNSFEATHQREANIVSC